MNPQKNDVPLKSYSFYNDTELNNYVSHRDDDISHNTGISNTFDNQLYGDYTYGLFVSSNTNFDGSLVFYSVRIRDFLYYLLSISVSFFSPLYLTFYSIANSILEQIFNIVHFRSIFQIFSVKNTALLALSHQDNTVSVLFLLIVHYLLDTLFYFQIILCQVSYLLSILDSLVQTLPSIDEYPIVINALNSPMALFSSPTNTLNNQLILFHIIKIIIIYITLLVLIVLV